MEKTPYLTNTEIDNFDGWNDDEALELEAELKEKAEELYNWAVCKMT
jgi:hypothetical protein